MQCPSCGTKIPVYRNPTPTVDIIIETQGGIVLIERKNPPFGWAIPGALSITGNPTKMRPKGRPKRRQG